MGRAAGRGRDVRPCSVVHGPAKHRPPAWLGQPAQVRFDHWSKASWLFPTAGQKTDVPLRPWPAAYLSAGPTATGPTRILADSKPPGRRPAPHELAAGNLPRAGNRGRRLGVAAGRRSDWTAGSPRSGSHSAGSHRAGQTRQPAPADRRPGRPPGRDPGRQRAGAKAAPALGAKAVTPQRPASLTSKFDQQV